MIDTGQLARAADTLLRADDLFAEVEPEILAAMWPLVPLGLSEIAARRGQGDAALAYYAEARELATRLGRPGLLAVARAMPAVHLPYQRELPWPLEDVLAEAEAAVGDPAHPGGAPDRPAVPRAGGGRRAHRPRRAGPRRSTPPAVTPRTRRTR